MISISPARVTIALILIVSVLMAVSIATDLMADPPPNLKNLVSVGREANIPTWYSSVSMLLVAALAWMISVVKKQAGERFVGHWRVLSLVFLFFSLDDTATIHELLTNPVRDALNTTGLLYFAWVIPGIIFVILFVAYFIPFLRHLPRRTMILFLAGGAVFVAGALGVEMVNALLYERWEQGEMSTALYNALTDLEEGLEKAGIVVFIYALLSYASRHVGRVELVFQDE